MKPDGKKWETWYLRDHVASMPYQGVDPFKECGCKAVDASAKPAADKGDNSPLVAEARAIFADEKLAEDRYVAAIAEGLKTPYVMFDQPNANEPLLAGNWRVLINVPSVVPGIGVAPTFDAATALRLTLRALKEKTTQQSFCERLQYLLPNWAWEELQTAGSEIRSLTRRESGSGNAFHSAVSGYASESFSTSGREKKESGEKGRMGDKWPCGLSFPDLRNPSWYFGFVDDTSIEVDGRSTIDQPMGTISFGLKNICQRRMWVPLPGVWNGSRNHFKYPIATRFSSSTSFDFEELLNDTEDAGWLWPDIAAALFLSFQSGLDTETDDSLSFRGMVVVWNADMWQCCFEPLYQYFVGNTDTVEWKGVNTNAFDNIEIRADYDPSGGQIIISSVQVILNAATLVSDTPNHVLMTISGAPGVDLSFDILQGRGHLLDPAGYAAPQGFGHSPRDFVTMAHHTHVIGMAVRELGQAWAPKYGGTWDYDDEQGGWYPGPFNWCSESSMWLLREANKIQPLLDLREIDEFYETSQGGSGQTEFNVSLTQWALWFMMKGRFLCGRTGIWRDLARMVFPGYWARVKDGGHATYFLYWTMPPRIPFPDDPGHPWNDPFNELPHRADWDTTAARFDPNAKVNRFRCIGGNQGFRVSVSNYSIVRVSSEDEITAWQGRRPLERSLGGVASHQGGMMYWREGEFGGKSLKQDGFGQTRGEPVFSPVPEAADLFNPYGD